MSSIAASGRQRSTYQLAIDTTQRAINARARGYRNLVVAVTLMLITPIIVALIMSSWLPLLGLGLVVPLYGAFAISDAQLVLAWQREILGCWEDHRLDLKPLRDTLIGIPEMPTRTLKGMLTMLPFPAAADATEVRSAAMRRSVAFVAREAHVVQQVQSLLTAAARLIALMSIVVSVALASLLPLLGLLAVPLLLALSAARAALARRRWRTEIAVARARGLDRALLRRQLAAVQCGDACAPFVRQLTDTAGQTT